MYLFAAFRMSWQIKEVRKSEVSLTENTGVSESFFAYCEEQGVKNAGDTDRTEPSVAGVYGMTVMLVTGCISIHLA